MKCVVCGKPLKTCVEPPKSCFTCSWVCAGKLALSTRQANILKKQFDNEEKNKIREIIYSKYVKPKITCEKPVRNCFNILDFWGGGLFSDYVIDHPQAVKNQRISVNLYEIDNNKKLFPALRKYARKKNQEKIVKNQNPCVIPFCGSLAEFVQNTDVKNQVSFDLIWLDYCDMGKTLEEDLGFIKELFYKKTVVVITVFCFNAKLSAVRGGQQARVENLVKKYLPQLDIDKTPIQYSKNMITFFFKQKYKFPKEVYYEAKKPDEIPNYASVKLA